MSNLRSPSRWALVGLWAVFVVIVTLSQRFVGKLFGWEVVDYAARLAAWHSKGRGAKGKVEVHVCRAGDVRKRRGAPAGQVELSSYTAVRIYAKEPPDGAE
jgi:predicted ribosome quality control (RQC) complex YloA/Tae2 family protein